MARQSRPMALEAAERRDLQRLVRSPMAHAGVVRRAQAVLLMADQLPGVEIARRTGYTTLQISRLRRRFAEERSAGLGDRRRSGRPKKLLPRKIAQVVTWTLKPPPAGLAHWSARALARRLGLSATMVHRIWHDHGFEPHRFETFKFTTDMTLSRGNISCQRLDWNLRPCRIDRHKRNGQSRDDWWGSLGSPSRHGGKHCRRRARAIGIPASALSGCGAHDLEGFVSVRAYLCARLTIASRTPSTRCSAFVILAKWKESGHAPDLELKSLGRLPCHPLSYKMQFDRATSARSFYKSHLAGSSRENLAGRVAQAAFIAMELT